MKVGVIFGGKSCEHDISIITGVMTVNAAKAAGHSVTPIYIDGGGDWYTGRDFDSVAVFAEKKYKKKKIHLLPADNGVYTELGRKLTSLDAVIICCHGRGGEDGCLAGLLELSGIPYAGGGVLAGAAGMDKVIQKKLFAYEGLNVTPFIGFDKYELESGFFDLVAEVKDKLQFPLMIKPARLGSSIGIGRAADFKELFLRLDEAFLWDDLVIVENALTDFIEVNCAVLGSGDKLIVSQIEQPLSAGFLSFKDKYCGDSAEGTDKNGVNQSVGRPKTIGKGDTGRYLPAHISPEMSARVRTAAKKVFKLIGCFGVARVDFLIMGDELFVNEINTVPGSLSSYLFAFDGMDFPLLVNKLLETAIKEHEKKQKLTFVFDSDVLKNKSGLGKKSKNQP